MWAACSCIAGKGAAGWWEGCVLLQEAAPSCGLSKKAQSSEKGERWPSPQLPRITWGSGMAAPSTLGKEDIHTLTLPLAKSHLWGNSLGSHECQGHRLQALPDPKNHVVFIT